jgi:hypothetical protein
METLKAPDATRGEMTRIGKSVVIKGELSCSEDLSPHPWKQISERLGSRLQEIGTSLGPLTACSGTNLN